MRTYAFINGPLHTHMRTYMCTYACVNGIHLHPWCFVCGNGANAYCIGGCMGEAIAMTWDPGWVVYKNKIFFVYERDGVRKREEELNYN